MGADQSVDTQSGRRCDVWPIGLRYQPEADTYICPAGHVLARKQEVLRRDRLILYVARDCTGCSLKPRCTTRL